MLCRVICVTCFFASILFLASANGQQTNSQSVQMRVMVPEKDAKVFFEGNLTK